MNLTCTPRCFRPNLTQCRIAGLALALGLPAAAALGQEATNTPAATQPGVGSWYLRERVQLVRMSDDPSPQDREIDKWIATTALTYGISRELSATLTLPLVYSIEDADGASGRDTEFGAGDASLSLKWRPFQWDLNPVDSVRVAFTAGVETPTGTGDLGSHSWDPYVGVIFTSILGRHGFNEGLSYKVNTGGDEFSTTPGDGTADALRYDTAYLFRVDPAAYTADTTAATYLTLELNGLYETNGDNEALLGPGILYEARAHALEATLGFPVMQDVDERAETDLVVTVGFRLLF
ncbi:MAG: hypothetical protein NTV94_14875 [Planctomycetota bacterium]|nr:hypothetical protein [Planctomycetota bacterium]